MKTNRVGVGVGVASACRASPSQGRVVGVATETAHDDEPAAAESQPGRGMAMAEPSFLVARRRE